jgi:hypothetical protein
MALSACILACLRWPLCCCQRCQHTCAGPCDCAAGRPSCEVLHCHDALGVIETGPRQQHVVPSCGYCAVYASCDLVVLTADYHDLAGFACIH